MNSFEVIPNFKEYVVPLIKNLHKFNQKQRKEILDVVTELTGHLDLALITAQKDLEALKEEKTKTGLVDKLRNGENRLEFRFREEKICHGIRNLKSQHSQLFSGIKLVINYGNNKKFEDFLDFLEGGERMVFDELANIFQQCRMLADEIQLSPESLKKLRRKLFARINKMHTEIERKRDKIRVLQYSLDENM